MLMKKIKSIIIIGVLGLACISCGKEDLDSAKETENVIEQKAMGAGSEETVVPGTRFHEEKPDGGWDIDDGTLEWSRFYIEDNYDFDVKTGDSALWLQLFLHRNEKEHRYPCVMIASFRPDGLNETDFLSFCEKEGIQPENMIQLKDDFNDKYCDRYFGELTADQIIKISGFDRGQFRVEFVGYYAGVERKPEWEDLFKDYIAGNQTDVKAIKDLPAEYINYLCNACAVWTLDESYVLHIGYEHLGYADFEDETYKKNNFFYDVSDYFKDHELTVSIPDESVMEKAE